MDSRLIFLHFVTGVMEGRIRLSRAELWLCPLVLQARPDRKIRRTRE